MEFGTGGNVPLRTLWAPGTLKLREPRLNTFASKRASKVPKSVTPRTFRVKSKMVPLSGMVRAVHLKT